MSSTTSSKTKFVKAVAAVLSLGADEQRKLVALLKKKMDSDPHTVESFIKELRDKRFRKGFACPHCHCEKVVRNGTQRVRQRYMCSDYGRTFSDHTHTPFRGTHYPDLWLPFMEHMMNGYSLRKTAKLLDISLSTAFIWQHKLLTALKRMEMDNFEGLLEIDETYFLFSEKGNKNIISRKPRKRGGSSKYRGISREQVCVVVARDHTKRTQARVACFGQVNKVKAKSLLSPYISSVSSICSDANRTWRAFSTETEKDHKELNLKRNIRVIKKIYHIQNANAFHSRLKNLIDRFKGVATKFLDNYLTWFRFIDAHAKEAMTAKKLELLLTACLPISPDRYVDIWDTTLQLP
jgi:transposase-like protein